LCVCQRSCCHCQGQCLPLQWVTRSWHFSTNRLALGLRSVVLWGFHRKKHIYFADKNAWFCSSSADILHGKMKWFCPICHENALTKEKVCWCVAWLNHIMG
jgi:hypothetical protein